MSNEKAKAKQIQVVANDATPAGSLQELIETRKILPTATTALDGAMSKEDKAKLEDLPTNSELVSTLDDKVGTLDARITAEVADITSDISELSTDKYDKTGGHISGDVSISGKLTVQGGMAEVEAEHVSTSDTIIRLNDGEVGAGVTSGFAGIEIDRGTEIDYEFGFNETTELFEVGKVGDRQPLLTRMLAPVANKFFRWNAATKQAETADITWGDVTGKLSNVSKAEAETGTNTAVRFWSSLRVREAIVAWFNGISGALGRTILTRTTAAQVRSDIGLGTAATKDVGTGSSNVMEVGAFGLGTTSLNSLQEPPTASGFYATGADEVLEGNTAIPANSFLIRLLGGIGRYFGALTNGSNTIFFKDWQKDPVFLHHTGNNRQTTGQSTEYPMSQKATTDALNTKAASSHTHPWSQVTGQPATATRWPTFAEVTGKPTTFTPSSHTHSLSEVTNAGNLAALNTNASTANFLRGDGTWVTPPNTNTTYTEVTTEEIDAGTASTLRTITGRRMKYALDKKADVAHTHSLSDITDAGSVALLNTNDSTANFLRGDGTWVTPPNTNTTYSEITTAIIDAGTSSALHTISGRRMKYALDKKADATHTHAWAEVADKPIVQTTGASTTDIMSQKAVTEAIADIEIDLDIVQETGQSEAAIMSQKATTDALDTKAPSSHTHTWSQVTDKPTTFAPSSHTHAYLPLAGGSLTGSLSVTGSITATGNVTAYSDKRLKTNIKVIDKALSKVLRLSGYTYDRTDIECPRQTGLIAQNVQEVIPEAVEESEDGTLSVAYGNMVGLLVEAIKEQQNQIDVLKAQIDLINRGM